MAKSPEDNRPRQAVRLLKAVEGARGAEERPQAAFSYKTVGMTPPATATPPKAAEKSPQRAIRFPKETNALRQYVGAVQVRQAQAAPVRPRPAPKPAAAADGEAAGPSATLRQRVVLARRASATVTHSALSRPAAAPDPFPSLALESAADIGRLVRERREQLRMSQAELARAAGAGRRFVGELEAGKPTAELAKVLAVCAALGLGLFAGVRSDGR